jgi:CheY-like chemotaxis protein
VLAREQVDLVFMDMHMPVMDGVEATLRIRIAEAEGELPGRRPIVAMTANVLKDAVDTCMEAGMDGFLPKPFARRQMIEVLTCWLGGDGNAGANTSPAKVKADVVVDGEPAVAPAVDPAIDSGVYSQLVETMGEDIGMLVEDFFGSTEEMLVALGRSPERDDVKLVTRLAHTLKSSAAMVGAMTLSAQAKQLEAQGKVGDLSGLAQALADLQVEFDRVRATLEAAGKNVAQVADV